MILYLIFLNNNTIEGNSDGEREIKYLEMLNINKLLDNLVNLYKRGEKDCIGDFEEYSPCDKKCGKSHKYKRYRVNSPAGIYGNDCLYEDGFTQQKLCDINDNILPCNVGDPCKINEDCIKKAHCNPDTELCENNDSCTGNNLNKCNKIQCNKLSKINPKYQWDNEEFKCYEIIEDEDEDEEDGANSDSGSISNNSGQFVPIEVPCAWYERDEEVSEFTKRCVNKSNSVEFINEDNKNNPRGDISRGLYCKLGYKFGGSNDMVRGISVPILQPNIDENTNWNNICTTKISENQSDAANCEDPYWPNLEYFLNTDKGRDVSYVDICSRCDNGYRLIDGVCLPCGKKKNNQYIINGGLYVKRENSDGIGQNTSCDELKGLTQDQKCNDLVNNACPNGSGRKDIKLVQQGECCKKCEAGKYSDDGVCTDCESGTYQNNIGQSHCEECRSDEISNLEKTGCERCPAGTFVNNGQCNSCPVIFDRYHPALKWHAQPTACVECPSEQYSNGKVACAQKCNLQDLVGEGDPMGGIPDDAPGTCTLGGQWGGTRVLGAGGDQYTVKTCLAAGGAFNPSPDAPEPQTALAWTGKNIAAVGREFQMHDDTLRPRVMGRESKVEWRGGYGAGVSADWTKFSAFAPGDVITPDQGMYNQDGTESEDAGFRGYAGHTGLYFCSARNQDSLSAFPADVYGDGKVTAYPGTYNFLKCDDGVITGANSEAGPWHEQLCP